MSDSDGPYAEFFDECRQRGLELEMHVSQESRQVESLKVTRLGQPKGEPVASVSATLATLDRAAMALKHQLGW